jgi:subtilisin-like proprotein convertase family protein
MRNRLPHILLAAVAAIVAALALSSSAMAETRAFSNADTIAPADASGGVPGTDPAHYPSEVKVAGVPGTITLVEARLNGLRTEFTGDVDILLESPSGQKVMLMSDVSGRNPLSFATIAISDHASDSLPESTPIADGAYKPTNRGGNDDVLPSPAPAGPYTATTMAAFNGAEPNGTWKLYVVDDAGADVNQIVLGWDLTLVTTGGKIFRNSTPILGTDRESSQKPAVAANPYPAKLEVSGLTRKIDRVTATLHDIDFEATADVDLLLVGPDGHGVVLTSDVGGGQDVSNADLSFDDAAESPVVSTASLVPGVHKPNDDDAGVSPDEPQGVDVFPAPAPQGVNGGALASFRNSDPNGEWRLFMMDDSTGDVNDVNGGWSLNFTLLPDAPVDQPAPAPEPQPAPQPEPGPAPAPAPTPEKPSPIAITGLKLKPSAFAAKKGTTISYRLSAAAKVKFSVKGHRGAVTQAGKPGANKLRFKPRKLAPGKYVLVAKAGSKVRTVKFRVTGRR